MVLSQVEADADIWTEQGFKTALQSRCKMAYSNYIRDLARMSNLLIYIFKYICNFKKIHIYNM